jgi:uncharacterized membrane protein (UPF0127 family)
MKLRSFILSERPEDRLRNRLVILGFIAFTIVVSYIVYGSVAYGLSKINVYYPNENTYVFTHKSDDPLKSMEIVCGQGNKFKTYTVEDEHDRDKGLSVFDSIKDSEAMMFVFETPGKYSFWMKGMKFPIDIVWLDNEGKIVDIKRHVATSTYPELFAPDSDSTYVVELNAGVSERLKIKIGDICNFDLSTLK